MQSFLAFEAAVLLLSGLAVLCLTSSDATLFSGLAHSSSQFSAQHAVSPDDTLALYWTHRVMQRPYRDWYLHDTAAYDGVPLGSRLDHDVVQQGGVVFPLHALYLRLCGLCMQWLMPGVAQQLRQASSVQGAAGGVYTTALRQTAAALGAACVVLVGAPGSWCLMQALTRLLTRAAREREKVARVSLPADLVDAADAPADASVKPGEEKTAKNSTPTPTASPETPAQTGRAAAACFCGALVLVVVGLLPLLVVEESTLQPWCAIASLLVWTLYAAVRNEVQLHAGEAGLTDDAFDLSAPIVKEGTVMFFALKTPPRVAPLMAMTCMATLLSLAVPSCLYVTPLFFLWALTSCWQHGYKRVLVKVQSPNPRSDPTADADGHVRVGYSCYLDKLHVNSCFSCASLASVMTVLILTTPWWWGLQPLLAFMDLFASPPLPEAGAAQQQHALPASHTGAAEMRAACLLGHEPRHTCALPTANLWRLSEWYGVPWTRVATRLTRLFIDDAAYVRAESARWLLFATVIVTVLLNASSVLVLTFYRVRKPPLSFETPMLYAAERAAHQAEQQAYWEQKQRSRQQGRKGGAGAAASGKEVKRGKVVTCLCREEYLVKQLVLLAWMAVLAVLSGTLLFVRGGPAGGAAALPLCGVLAGLYAMLRVLRAAHPLAFYRAPTASPVTSSPSAAAAAGGSSAGEGVEKDDPSALTQQDRDNPRPPAASRWCTSAVAPSLAHVADVAWVTLLAAGTLLSTGALTWAVVPAPARNAALGVTGCLCGFGLWRLRRWAKKDGTSGALCGASAVLIPLAGLVHAAFHAGGVAVSPGGGGGGGDQEGTAAAAALLPSFVLQCAVGAAVYVVCVLHATLRIGRLALEPEEVRLVPIESELSFFSKPAPAKKQQ